MTTGSSAVRGPYRTGVRRRAQITEAATTIFARRGYAGASLRQIGAAVGMSPAGLLRHFSSKEDLFLAVLNQWEDRVQHLRPTPSQVGIDYFSHFPRIMEFHMANPGLVELFLTVSAEVSDPTHPARTWVRNRYAQIVKEATENLELAADLGQVRTMNHGQIEHEVRGLFGVMDGLELQWLSDPTLDLVAMFDHTFQTTLRRWGATGIAVQMSVQ